MANPEILELKFGCEIKGGRVIICEHRELTDDYAVNVVDCWGFSRTYIVHDVKSKEFQNQIIGRPIRLADVLMAIWAYVPEVYSVLSNGDILNTDNEVVARWELKYDDLDWQPLETRQFLYELLTKK